MTGSEAERGSTEIFVLVARVRNLAPEIMGFTAASLCDLLSLLGVSLLFQRLSLGDPNSIFFLLALVALVVSRSALVFLLRRWAVNSVFRKKNVAEDRILRSYVNSRVNNLLIDEAPLVRGVKEKLINSTQLAAVNFDIPVLILIGELIFAAGGIGMLAWNLGIFISMSALPVVILLILLMRAMSIRLRNLGREIMSLTATRLEKIDNIVESAIEISVVAGQAQYTQYFDRTNSRLNNLLATQITTSSSVQLLVESAAFIMTGAILFAVVSGAAQLSIPGVASSIAVLARFVPTVTRSIASVTQLNYGIPAVLGAADNAGFRQPGDVSPLGLPAPFAPARR